MAVVFGVDRFTLCGIAHAKRMLARAGNMVFVCVDFGAAVVDVAVA